MRRRPSAVGALILIALTGWGCSSRQKVQVGPVWSFEQFEEVGTASWYGRPFHGRQTASGERYDMDRMTAAHRTLPLGTWVEITNLGNGRTVRAKVNDRGPFIDGRILDGSRAVARALDYEKAGLAQVGIRILSLPEGSRWRPPEPAGGPAAGTAPAPATGNLFAVQLGAFRDRDNAERLRAELESSYGVADVARADGLYRVRVGAFRTAEEADWLLGVLREDGHDGFVTTVRAD